MKNIERSIYIAIIVILVGVLSCGITYIVMKDKNSTDTQDNLKENNNSSINNKSEEEEPTLTNGVKLLRTYQENNKIFQEYEITLNSNKKMMNIAYVYEEKNSGEKNISGTSYNNLLFCDLEFYGNDITKSSVFNFETIKKHFNENNFQLVKGQDGKNYLTVWTSSDYKEYLYIFNDNLELLTDESFEDEIDEASSKYGMTAFSTTFVPIVNGTNPSYKYKFKKETELEEDYIRVNVNIEQNNIHYLVLVNPLYKADTSAYDQTILEERVYQINNNKLTYKVIHTYPAEFANATY